MSKHIIDFPDGVEWGVVTCRTEDGFYTRDFDSLEELNSDYINEHYGELQDEAYQKGFEDGKKYLANGCVGCQYDGDESRVNPCCECARVCDDHYIPKHSDRIEVGDEVKHHFQGYGVVTRIKEVNEKTHYNAVWSNGNTGYYDSDDLTKTGKHYDIQSILEAMRE